MKTEFDNQMTLIKDELAKLAESEDEDEEPSAKKRRC